MERKTVDEKLNTVYIKEVIGAFTECPDDDNALMIFAHLLFRISKNGKAPVALKNEMRIAWDFDPDAVPEDVFESMPEPDTTFVVCNDEGEQWMPLFTSREEMGELAESNEVVEVPIREILEKLCDDPALAGLVINPETDKFAIDRDGVKYLLEEVDAFEAMTEDDEGIDIDEEE
ncbi:MAG: SseB family protein [Clostridiales bacterium]|nr:SseB family protein [Clostridiales bacterium]